MPKEMRMEAIKATADEVHVTLEAASRFANEKEMQQLAINVDEVCRKIFGTDVWRNATYEGM